MGQDKERQDRMVLIGLLLLAAFVGAFLTYFVVLGQGLAE